MSIVGIVLIIIFALIIIVLICASLIFYRISILRETKSVIVDHPELEQILTSDVPVVNPVWVDAQPFELLTIKSYDGLRLKGYYLAASSPTTRTVILAHGYRGSAKENMGEFARMYHEELGYNIFMPDARGHGLSEGSYVGLGWHDRLDYIQWIQVLIQRIGANAQIVLHGMSMGGATVLMVSGEQLPEQVKYVIADCAYTSANDIFAYQAKVRYKLPPFPIIPSTSIVCKLRAGFFIGEASALKQVKKTTKPTLFIHGDIDTFVPTEMVYRLYEACPTHKEILVIPGAEHGVSYIIDPLLYTQKVKTFLEELVEMEV